MIIHFLIPDPNGNIWSAPGGTTFKIGTHARYRICCNPRLQLDHENRASTEPWAVQCATCQATPEFKENDRPRPNMAPT